MIIEKRILDYLVDQTTAGANVFCEKRKDTPSKYILIEKLGGGSQNRIKSATIAIQSIDISLFRAMQLNEEIKAAMENIDSLDEICSCELNSDYNYTNTATKEYRYQAVFDITHY